MRAAPSWRAYSMFWRMSMAIRVSSLPQECHRKGARAMAARHAFSFAPAAVLG
jgi:hypothetical protein